MLFRNHNQARNLPAKYKLLRLYAKTGKKKRFAGGVYDCVQVLIENVGDARPMPAPEARTALTRTQKTPMFSLISYEYFVRSFLVPAFYDWLDLKLSSRVTS